LNCDSVFTPILGPVAIEVTNLGTENRELRTANENSQLTDRLYYRDPLLFNFDAQVVEASPEGERLAVVLDCTAFYPASGGQIFDTGKLRAGSVEFPVAEVAERDDGIVVHYVRRSDEAQNAFTPGAAMRGTIDAERRRDHMQQHTGQHVLSAAFIRLFDMPTVSFHMGAGEDATCTIDLDTTSVTSEQAVAAERLANEVLWEDRPVEIRFVSLEEARRLGLRKLPPREGEIRLIEVRDFDLTACGGTHVARTGQIGAVLLRKIDKVRQGTRVEFVCGLRAVGVARRDYGTLTSAAEMLSAHIWELPQQVGKQLEEVKSARKREQHLLEEIAGLEAARLLRGGEQCGEFMLVSKIYEDRDPAFIKLVAQKAIATEVKAVVMLGALGGQSSDKKGDQPTVVLAQTPGLPFNAGGLLKDALAAAGGRGGGSRDLAQGGVPDAEKLRLLIAELGAKLRS
jgi:alanyl-tRNA synthetase